MTLGVVCTHHIDLQRPLNHSELISVSPQCQAALPAVIRWRAPTNTCHNAGVDGCTPRFSEKSLIVLLVKILEFGEMSAQ